MTVRKKASQKEVSMLDGAGVLALVYPRTAAFDQPLPVFEFPKSTGLKLWVLPFCLKGKRLLLPSGSDFEALFDGHGSRLRNGRDAAEVAALDVAIT